MRGRMRAELDRSDAARLDLKQGEGGVVDLEFALQTGVLALAQTHPAVLADTRSLALIDALAVAGWWDEQTADALHQAHRHLLDIGLACTLDRRPRTALRDEALEQSRQIIRSACQRSGLVFDKGKGDD